MAIAKTIKEKMEKGSFIRKMFEEGDRLKAIHGPENVFDFSLGNPNLDPPEAVNRELIRILKDPLPALHGYMPNAGYAETRRAVAEFLSREHDLPFSEKEVVMTCGAAGAINVVLKAVLEPGDEVIIPAPYFVEYLFYVDNFQGIPKVVSTSSDFSLDLEAIEKAITGKTKVVLINSPNNPTGRVYDRETIFKLGELLEHKREKEGQVIYLISDEPYRKIVYDGIEVPSIFQACRQAISVTSYSKDLSLPGERIGYLAIHPRLPEKDELAAACTFTNRILGFVNAPALMQRLLPAVQGLTVDIEVYKRRRDLFYEGLSRIGYQSAKPEGAFYLFPRSPIPDDVAFIRVLQEERILAVPGSGFGTPGYFRLAYCTSDEVIERSLPGFERAFAKVK
jgi:aspartate aminotransferase